MSFLPLSVPAVIRIPFPAHPRDSFGRRKREKSKPFLFMGRSRGTEQRSPPALPLCTPVLASGGCRQKLRVALMKCKYICRTFPSIEGKDRIQARKGT